VSRLLGCVQETDK